MKLPRFFCITTLGAMLVGVARAGSWAPVVKRVGHAVSPSPIAASAVSVAAAALILAVALSIPNSAQAAVMLSFTGTVYEHSTVRSGGMTTVVDGETIRGEVLIDFTRAMPRELRSFNITRGPASLRRPLSFTAGRSPSQPD